MAIGLVVWLAPGVLSAQTPLGTEFQVNTYTTGIQGAAEVASDASGNFVVVWANVSPQDGSGSGVFGQRYDSSGSALGTEFQVNTYTTNDQYSAAVASDSSGNFVVVWGGAGLPTFGLFGQRFDSTGAALGTELQVNTYTSGSSVNPSVASDASGKFVVVWEDQYAHDGSNSGVFGQRFDSTGASLGTEFQVNTYTTGFQRSPDIASDPSGNFVVVWSSLYQDGFFDGVFAQRFDSSGAAAGTEFQVNTYTTHNQRDAHVATDSSGNFVVTWASTNQFGPQAVIGQRFDSAGSAVGTEFHVNTTPPVDNAGLASDASGNFVVTYDGNDGFSYGVFGQLFASTGSKLGNEFLVNTTTFGQQVGGAVVRAPAGDFVVVWQSTYFDGSSIGVAGQQFSSAVVPLSTPTATQTAQATDSPLPSPTDTPTSTPGACAPTPLMGCVSPGKSILLIKDHDPSGPSALDKLLWKWLKGPLTQQ